MTLPASVRNTRSRVQNERRTAVPVCCAVCHEQTAVLIVTDHGYQTYPACSSCTDEMRANARYSGTYFYAEPIACDVEADEAYHNHRRFGHA